ncbi:hypothetical protein ACFLXB_02780 [Chloroflexota bacterium]
MTTEIVECHSGHEYGERPIALTWKGNRLEIAGIVSRWRIPEGKCFRVETTDNQVFELTYIELSDEWRIHQP